MLGLLGAFIVACIAIFCWVASLGNSATTTTTEAAPTDAPVATSNPREDDRRQREAAQQYWNRTMGELALAGGTIEIAMKSEQAGDAVGAQQILSEAEKAADYAYAAASANTPDGDAWTDIQGALMNAAKTYKKAIGEFKDGLASDNSETLAQAADDAANAGNNLTNATHEVRVWCEQNGGKWSDIEDYQTAEGTAASTLKALTQQ